MIGELQTTVALVLAFILGWVADWLLEVFHWRRSRQQRERARVQAQLDSKDARMKELEVQLASLRASATPKAHGLMQTDANLNAAREEMASLRRILKEREEEIGLLHQQLGIADDVLTMPEILDGPVSTIEAESMADRPAVSSSGSARITEEETSLDEAARRMAAWLSDVSEFATEVGEESETQTEGKDERTESGAGEDEGVPSEG